jgi:hypothetical protein
MHVGTSNNSDHNATRLAKSYYLFHYPFLIYGLVIWGNTYSSSINPLFIYFTKKVVRLMATDNFL